MATYKERKNHAKARFYNLNSLLGNHWALFYVIIGSRMTGKSYAVTKFLCNQKKLYGADVKNYWMRISETSTKALLCNKANKLVDPDLVRLFDLELTTKGMDVYNKGEHFMTVCPLSQFGKLKGVGFYDKDFKGWTNIVLDEFQLEQGEKRTSFSVLYNFMGMCENIARTNKQKVRVFLIGNTLEEASSILKAFNFLPEKVGRFYLRSKRCVIDNIENTEEYLKDRQGSIADILGGNNMSNYTNELRQSRALIYKGRLQRPTEIIMFGKDKDKWFTVWDDNIIRRYNKENVKKKTAMRPYLDVPYVPDLKTKVFERFDAQLYRFNNLVSQAFFIEQLTLLRKT